MDALLNVARATAKERAPSLRTRSSAVDRRGHLHRPVGRLTFSRRCRSSARGRRRRELVGGGSRRERRCARRRAGGWLLLPRLGPHVRALEFVGRQRAPQRALPSHGRVLAGVVALCAVRPVAERDDSASSVVGPTVERRGHGLRRRSRRRSGLERRQSAGHWRELLEPLAGRVAKGHRLSRPDVLLDHTLEAARDLAAVVWCSGLHAVACRRHEFDDDGLFVSGRALESAVEAELLGRKVAGEWLRDAAVLHAYCSGPALYLGNTHLEATAAAAQLARPPEVGWPESDFFAPDGHQLAVEVSRAATLQRAQLFTRALRGPEFFDIERKAANSESRDRRSRVDGEGLASSGTRRPSKRRPCPADEREQNHRGPATTHSASPSMSADQREPQTHSMNGS